MNDNSPLPALDEWQSLELGLIAFPVQPQYAIEQSWLNDLTGGMDFSSTRKRFGRTDEGSLDGRAFSLEIDPLRIVWKAMAIVDVENAELGAPTIGSYVDSQQWFAQLMRDWLVAMCPPISRLAFIGKLMLPTASREAAYGLLDRFLTKVTVEADSTEFQYRVNRKRLSDTGLTINRLATWSAVKIGLKVVARQAEEATGQVFTGREFEGCLLQLDINTVPETPDALPHDLLGTLWNELNAFGREIAEHGDRT